MYIYVTLSRLSSGLVSSDATPDRLDCKELLEISRRSFVLVGNVVVGGG